MPAEEGRCTAYAHIRRFKLRCRAGCRARICCSDRGGWAHLPQNLQLSPRRKLCRADAGYLSGPPARLQLSTVLGLEREQVSAATAGGGVKGWGCFFRLILSQRGTLLRQQLDVLLSAPSRAFLPRRGATFYPLSPLLPLPTSDLLFCLLSVSSALSPFPYFLPLTNSGEHLIRLLLDAFHFVVLFCRCEPCSFVWPPYCCRLLCSLDVVRRRPFHKQSQLFQRSVSPSRSRSLCVFVLCTLARISSEQNFTLSRRLSRDPK